MKTILVLTDFSNNALRAAEAAVILAGEIHANLLVMHSDNSIPMIPYYKGMPVITENISWESMKNEQMDKLVAHLESFANLNVVPHHKLSIHVRLMTGDLQANVKEIVKEKIIELIIIGARSGSKFDHILFGSDTNALIEHTECPVLIIPQNYNFRKLDRVIFATNFNETDVHVINYLFKLGKLLQYQLEIVHVSLYGDKPGLKNESVRGYINSLSEKKYPAVLFRDIRGKRLLPRLIKHCQERETDILALSYQHHSFVMRILKEGTVKMSIGQQKIPILVFHSAKPSVQQKGNEKNTVGSVFL
ncbi:universal stress protein [Pedobacter sp. ASV1-7]|uniref:universal stress protein n=1 Tax=Pedobacter sp. ASV1-7 TaxID=3145237 RepID=UPI0032E8573F